jgi:two-component system, sporulation sensor kinase E
MTIMSPRKSSPLDNVLGRLDDLDPQNLTILVQRLARERKLLETVLGTIREGIMVIGAGGVIEYANASAAQLLGFSPKDVGKTVLWKCVPELARTLHLSVDGALADVSGISREVEVTYPSERVLCVYIVPLHIEDSKEDGRQIGHAVIVSDITEEKESARKTIESEKVQSIIDLSAGVAHELGNPLNSININLQLARKNLEKAEPGPKRDKIEKSIKVCIDEVERLDGIVKHFLEAVRPSEPDFAELDLAAVLEESLEFVGQELSDAGLAVDVDVGTGLPPVLGDRGQIKQVFFNIMKNAREATPSGGHIRIRTYADDDFAYVQIADNGSGIDEADMPKIFRPYFTTKATGNGLGMMVVQRIMRAHGGRIGVDSRKGSGTVVTLQFPQKQRRVRMLQGPTEMPDDASRSS